MRKLISLASLTLLAGIITLPDDPAPPAGTPILGTAENLSAKRPGTGISPMRWDEVIGRPALRDFEPDDLISL